MGETINIYCDESCHLQNDGQPIMLLGAVWSPLGRSEEINKRIYDIKQRHGLQQSMEIKWNKVSPAMTKFYLDIVDCFFDEKDLHFRGLVVNSKDKLDHRRFDQSHDEWYFKMYFSMLKTILDPEHDYRIYLDIKDTRSAGKVSKLHEVLCNSIYDFRREIIQRIQTVRSHEVTQIQLADLLIGAIGYENRGLQSSGAKRAIVSKVKDRSGYSLKRSTLLGEKKFNLFHWQPQ